MTQVNAVNGVLELFSKNETNAFKVPRFNGTRLQKGFLNILVKNHCVLIWVNKPGLNGFSGLLPGKMGHYVRVTFPVLPVKWNDAKRLDRGRIQAANVYAETIGV